MTKRTNNDLQNMTQKTIDWVTRTLLNPWGELKYSERVSSSRTTIGTRRVAPVQNRK